MSQLKHSPAGILITALVSISDIHAEANATPLPNGAFIARIGWSDVQPDKEVVGYDTTPVKEADLLAGGAVQQWGISIIVRAGQYEYDEAYEKATELGNKISASAFRGTQVEYKGIRYVIRSAIVESGPIPMGREPDKNRPMFSINILANIGAIT